MLTNLRIVSYEFFIWHCSTNFVLSSGHDPAQCAVCQSDGSNPPFHVPFDISLDGLHHIVGKKLGCFPGHVLL